MPASTCACSFARLTPPLPSLLGPTRPAAALPALQGRGTNAALERGEVESLFREHVTGLFEAALEGFVDLLDKEIKVGCLYYPNHPKSRWTCWTFEVAV